MYDRSKLKIDEGGGETMCGDCYTSNRSNRNSLTTPDLKLFKKIMIGVGIIFVVSFSGMIVVGLLTPRDEAGEKAQAELKRNRQTLDKVKADQKQLLADSQRGLGYVDTGLPLLLRIIDDEGKPDNSVTFRNFNVDALSQLKATMTWHGRRFDVIGYTVKKSGVVKNRGKVSIPGDGVKKDEPVEVSLFLGTDPASDVDVTIEIVH